MLSAQDNEALTRVGPGTLMGELFRQYWQPVLYSHELPHRDSPPVRVRLLGEDLIAFRASDGLVGLIAATCPHRGASMFFGRNEERGLRCVYHGWKFDVTGRCVDMPSEPTASNFSSKVRIRAYPCREVGGVIWTYMGEGTPPDSPALEWVTVPESHRYLSKRFHECNWAQGLEGDLDSSHVGILHSNLDRGVFGYGQKADQNNYMGEQRQPRIEALEADFGLWVAARRPSKEGKEYCRATALVLPFYAIIPPRADLPIHVNAWQPIDDEHTMVWSIQYHAVRPIPPEEREKLGSGLYEHYGPDDCLPPSSAPGGAWRSKANRANDFQIDRDMQCTQNFTGLRGFWRQDRAVVESMGPISDRSLEHLITGDVGIVRFRRLMLRLARALGESGALPPARDAETQKIRSVATLLAEGSAWQEAVTSLCRARDDHWPISP